MKRLILLTWIMVMCFPAVSALLINNTVLNSTGLNTTITITSPWNVSNATVASDYIYVENLSNSNPGTTNLVNDTFTFKLVQQNKRYYGTDLKPWLPATTMFQPESLNVTYILGFDMTFSRVLVNNDSIQLNDTIIRIIPQPVGLSLNLTLYNLTSTFMLFNVSSQDVEGANATVTISGGGVGSVYNSSVYYNETLKKYGPTNTSVTFGLDTQNKAELEIGYANYLYVDFWDEKTDTQLTDTNVSLEVWGDNYVANYTSTTNLSVQRLPNGEYELRYWATGYPIRSYYVMATGNINQTLRLYLLNDTYADQVLFKATDTTGKGVSYLTVMMQRRFISCNCYRTVEMAKSDANGEGVLRAVEMYNIPYKFILMRNSTVYKNLDPQQVVASTLYFTNINLFADTLLSFWYSRNVYANLQWVNATNCFEFTYIDAGNWLRAGRLLVQRTTSLATTTICDQTVYAASATLECNLSSYTGQSGQYLATGYVDSPTNASWYDVARAAHQFWTTREQMWGLSGPIYGFMMISTMALIGIWQPVAIMIMGSLGVVFAFLLGFIPVGWSAMIGVIIVALMYVFRRRS